MRTISKYERNRLLKMTSKERKIEREEGKKKLYQEALKKYPETCKLSKAQAIEYKEALSIYPDLKSLPTEKLKLIAFRFRQEQIKNYHTEHTSELADARCNVQLGGYKNEIITEDLPALSFEKECIVCHFNKKGISMCPECWQLLRKCLDLKGKGLREGWDAWGVEMNLDLSGLVQLLRSDKEGSELLDAKITQEISDKEV